MMVRMNNISKTIFIESEEKMQQLAVKLADLSQKGDVFLLDGELGAGKSFFSRQFIKHIGRKQGYDIKEVPSPTFTLVQTYDQLQPAIWHFDLYRLSCADEVYELGLEEAAKSAICLIEWPSRLADDLPENTLNIFFKHDGLESRNLEFVLNSHWATRLKHLF